jgi:eukaryotic-like serine/threonine-protein kinase
MKDNSKSAGEDEIDVLLERYEERKSRGETPDLMMLCGDHPELIRELQRRVAELDKVGALLEDEGGAPVADPFQPFELIQHDEVELTLRLNELTLFDLGGMGVIGRAKDSDLRRDVAVKFIKPSNNSPINNERFLNEAKVTGRMAHPGILPVYGYGKTPDNLPFYAMRYVTGPTFEEAINDYHRERKNQTKRQQISELKKLLTHFVSVAYTIAYAHERGVVHCDLKPRNILLGTFGETYVIDWGLAVGVSPSRGNFTGVADRREAHGAGTDGYSHPDQLTGKCNPNRDWDIYGLGAVLYKLLTNRVTNDRRNNSASPKGEGHSSVASIQTPRMIDRSVPAPVESICLQALGIRDEHHYERASEVADDVQRYLSGEPVAGHSETLLEKVFRWQRSHQGATKIAGILLLLLVSVLIISSFSLWRFAESNEVKTRQSLETAVKFAAQTVELEMNSRWQALNLAARDPRLVGILKEIKDQESTEVSAVLKARIKYHRNAFQAFQNDTWFLCSATGRQVARSPTSYRSEGKSFSHRDYFHGNGIDYEQVIPGEPLPGEPPMIEQPHLSVVYLGTTEQKLKVAYSVPVHVNPGTDTEEFVGVIVMSVQLGRFQFLNGDMLRNHHLILVDLREDWLSGDPMKGLVLHHPDLERRVTEIGDSQARPRLEGGLVKRLLANDTSFYLEDFVDPVLGRRRGSLAAFAKVSVGSDPDSAWAVVVREDRAATGLFE